MRYLRCFKFSDETVKNPNLYPYNVFKNKTSEMLVFDTVTMVYGDNGSGKSSFLNLLAMMLELSGAEPPKVMYVSDERNFFNRYLKECLITFDCDENGREYKGVPANSRYIKSEDILYEIKKVQQEAVLQEGLGYERRRLGMTREELKRYTASIDYFKQLERHKFAQEKYSNGETALQVFEDYLVPDGLYLLDEPEVSLSPARQLELAGHINQCARLLGAQFIIATHSPLLLGSIEGTIYNFSSESLCLNKWTELPSVKVYADFFRENGHFF